MQWSPLKVFHSKAHWFVESFFSQLVIYLKTSNVLLSLGPILGRLQLNLLCLESYRLIHVCNHTSLNTIQYSRYVIYGTIKRSYIENSSNYIVCLVFSEFLLKLSETFSTSTCLSPPHMHMQACLRMVYLFTSV